MQSRRELLKWTAIGSLGLVLGASPLLLNSQDLPSPTKVFLKACIAGHTDKVQSLLATNPSLAQAKDRHGRSAFTLALLAQQTAVGMLLRNAGYQPDLHELALALDWDTFEKKLGTQTEKTYTQINQDHLMGGNVMWAAAAGGAGSDMWRVYAKCGDPDFLPDFQKDTTPLQAALRFPDLAIAEISAATLLSNQADPNAFGQADRPPLAIAAERGSVELVEMLIRLGADPRLVFKGKTALELAEKKGHLSILDLLKKEAALPRTCRTSRAAYTISGAPYKFPDLTSIPLYQRSDAVGMSHRNMEGIKKALAANPLLVHSIATTGEKAVEAAAHMGNQAIGELLLEKGAPYALPTAVMMNDVTTVKRLLDEDPNRIQERGAHDFALLWYPIIGKSDPAMMELLLARGAKVEQQHFLGTTALHWACLRGSIEMVELLVENGADLNRPGRKFSATPQRPLAMVRDEKIAQFLKSKGAK